MKILVLWVAILAGAGLASNAQAESEQTGFFLGGAGGFQWFSGSGTWNGFDFEIDQPLSGEDGSPIGLSWDNRALLGIKPMAGYRFNRSFAVQVGYNLNIPKSSQQTYSETDGIVTYEQGMTVEWTQRNVEVLGIYYPDAELGYYFFGGLDLARAETKITLFENADYIDNVGDSISAGDFEVLSDHITATGFILGAGVEFASDSNKRVAFASVQYSRSMTDGAFFGTDDFKVDMGGISLVAGIKWYPFVPK